MLSFNELNEALLTYLPADQCNQIHKAYQLAYQAHQNQKRFSGEPYITHPLAVALILAHFYLDSETIQAALLHDVTEDTNISKAELTEHFGPKVAELVDGVSKLKQIKFPSQAHEQAENLRKMMFAVAQDLRVLLIKLADRLHNMRTIELMPKHKIAKKARETLEIYAPIAHRLGMNALKNQFEDLGFKSLYPWRHHVLKEMVAQAHYQHRDAIKSIHEQVLTAFEMYGIKVHQFELRIKNVYSIYKKMKRKKIKFSQVFDLMGFRLVLYATQDCYRALGVLHGLFKPILPKFKDYIAIPKTNGYQSLHTTLIDQRGFPFEFQIRSLQMDLVAENGIASHWLYKAESPIISKQQMIAHEWIKHLLDLHKASKTPIEFVEHLKIDLDQKEVHLFDEKGSIWSLPKGATALDLAYARSLDEGHHTIGCLINRVPAPLSTVLESGQTVEVLLSPTSYPSPVWLTFAVTGRARANIRYWLRGQQHQHAIDLGRRLIAHELSILNRTMDDFLENVTIAQLKQLQVSEVDQLMEELGLGKRSVTQLIHRILKIDPGSIQENRDTALSIKGDEGFVLTYPKCCMPIPGDEIIGIVRLGQGLVVHRKECAQIVSVNSNEWSLPLTWDIQNGESFHAQIQLLVADTLGVLGTLATHIAEYQSNIINVFSRETVPNFQEIKFLLRVKDTDHLNKIITRLASLDFVQSIERI